MKIRQEDSTPIGDFFHDSGVNTVYNAIANTVDEFEVDTDQLTFWCDAVIDKMKQLKSQISKVEKAWQKAQYEKELSGMINRGAE